MMELSEKMIKFRARNRMTQKDRANAAGVSLQTICNIETGQQSPSRVTAEKILLVIGGEEEC